MKKLLILSDDDEGGGTAYVARHLAMGLSDSFPVNFGFNRNQISDNYYAPLASAGIKLLDSRCAESNKYRSAYKSDEAISILGSVEPDAILFVDAGNVYSHIALKLEALRRGIPYLAVINGMPENARTLQRPLLPAAIETLNGAQHVVFVSAANLIRFKRLFPEVNNELFTIPNACAGDFFEVPPPIVRDERRRELGLMPHEILVLTTARVEPTKGHELAIHALAQLMKDHGNCCNIKLGFAGTARNDYELKLKALCDRLCVGDHVLMLGYRSDVKDLLAAADIFCLPSYAEGMPISIIEAMAMNVPVVATAVDGIPEQIDEASAILVCPPQTNEVLCIEQLAAAFTKLRNSKNTRRSLAAAARERALVEFHPSINVERYRQLIQPLTEKRGATFRDITYGKSAAPLKVGSSVAFGSLEEAWKVLDSGWGAARRRGVWSEGDASSLTIRICSNIKQPLISLRIEPHLRGPSKAQHVEIVVDGETLGVLRLFKKTLIRSSWLHLHLDPSPTDRVIRVDFLYSRSESLNQPGERGRSVLISHLHIGDMDTTETRLATRFLRRGSHLGPRKNHPPPEFDVPLPT